MTIDLILGYTPSYDDKVNKRQFSLILKNK